MIAKLDKNIFADASAPARELEECPICFEEFGDDEEVIELNCAKGHIFHIQCIKSWLYSQKRQNTDYTCPLCRAPINANLN
jgi:hypothetical protein